MRKVVWPRRVSAAGSGALLRLAQRLDRELPLLARGSIEDQDSVKVVHLVLDHARFQARCLDKNRRAVLVLGPDPHVHRPFDIDVHRRQAEAALLGDLLLRIPSTRAPG